MLYKYAEGMGECKGEQTVLSFCISISQEYAKLMVDIDVVQLPSKLFSSIPLHITISCTFPFNVTRYSFTHIKYM